MATQKKTQVGTEMAQHSHPSLLSKWSLSHGGQHPSQVCASKLPAKAIATHPAVLTVPETGARVVPRARLSSSVWEGPGWNLPGKPSRRPLASLVIPTANWFLKAAN